MPTALRPAARAATDLLLSRPLPRRAALRIGAERQRTIVLLWHRVGPEGPQPHEVVRTLALDDFRRQIDLLQQMGTIVPLAECDGPFVDEDNRPRFVLTFDDDDHHHSQHVLPVLLAGGLPATFFLSGRWLHGYGPYWWELLEQEIATEGTARVAGRHGLPPDATAPRIGQALTGTAAAQRMAEEARRAPDAPMDDEEMRALVDAGMEIAFHTIDHDLLPGLSDAALDAAVSTGRDRLSAATGVPIERFAYPHGGADERTAAAVGRAGYRSAWTTAKRSARPADAPMLRGRWDLGHRSLDEMRRSILRAMVRPRP
ncbi:hypothetical protein BH23ACT9_BH23ACT9_29080 [soil metagenome]